MRVKKLAILTVALAAFSVLMYFEWINKKTPGVWGASALFGPLHLVTDVSRTNSREGLVFCVILIPTIFLFFLKPHPITAVLSLIGIAMWLLLGVIGKGIAC